MGFFDAHDGDAHSLLKRVLAQTEIRFSNSMIEAWWRSLKHHGLYLHPLDSMAKVRSLVEFYVAEHNSRLPHSAFRGQTPDEMNFETGDAVPDEFAQARRAARDAQGAHSADASKRTETSASIDHSGPLHARAVDISTEKKIMSS